MNLFYLFAAIAALLACVGHLTYGYRRYLQPMRSAAFDSKAKVAIHSVFNALGIFQLLSTLMLLACGLGWISSMQNFSLLLFIALNYVLFALWQLYIGFTSDLNLISRLLLQWPLFFSVGLLTLLGALLH
ncbi:hypothetical protein [Shewanella sp. Isolate11]|uniref:hypothetical protein n=1 Tax=Shewanella sp. Isolate11 TaxID=2908530 RepID=UPI001EFD5CA4|nr:hypothetical protein [Shewanella sp. Isolate11]MCG9696447.1 hypothetical protein [Shewanella sp. Isolate11]